MSEKELYIGAALLIIGLTLIFLILSIPNQCYVLPQLSTLNATLQSLQQVCNAWLLVTALIAVSVTILVVGGIMVLRNI